MEIRSTQRLRTPDLRKRHPIYASLKRDIPKSSIASGSNVREYFKQSFPQKAQKAKSYRIGLGCYQTVLVVILS